MTEEAALVDFTPRGLLAFLRDRGIDCEVIAPGVPMPTVPLAAAAIGVDPSQIVKTLLFENRSGAFVRVIACGPDRIDSAALAAASGVDTLRLARPEVVLAVTGWPAGGVSPIGIRQPVRTLVDTRVTMCGIVYGGAGTHETLLRVRPPDIVALTGATVATLIAEPPATAESAT